MRYNEETIPGESIMLYEQILEKAKSVRAAALANMKLEDHLVRQLSPGHTSVVCNRNRLHNVISTAVYYADKTALGLLDAEEGLAILQKIAAMQVDKPGTVSVVRGRTAGAGSQRRPQKLTLGKSTGRRSTVETEFLTVIQTLYEGEETRLDFRSLETAWAMIVLDRELDDAEAYLKTVEVQLESVADMEVYRLKDAMINRITLTAEGKTVTLTHDPYDRKAWN